MSNTYNVREKNKILLNMHYIPLGEENNFCNLRCIGSLWKKREDLANFCFFPLPLGSGYILFTSWSDFFFVFTFFIFSNDKVKCWLKFLEKICKYFNRRNPYRNFKKHVARISGYFVKFIGVRFFGRS